MQLRQIGELKLLEEIRRRFSAPKQKGAGGVIIGIGDDAAAFDPPLEKIVVTTDLMHEGIHFDLSYTAPFHLGFKLVSVNVSDIMAMGGTPSYLLLSLSMRNNTDEIFFRKFYDGISDALQLYGMTLLGGDLSAARNDMVFSATVIGACGKPVTRGGASPGDGIYVTSALGDSACGLELLRRLTPESRDMVKNAYENKTSPAIRLTGFHAPEINWKNAEPLIMRHLMPTAREVRGLLPHITSMIDISDGLFIDLCRICDESHTGARIYLEKIPISAAMRLAAERIGLSPVGLATSGGEDYELLFTSQKAADTLEGVNVFRIGEIIEKDRVIVDSSGKETLLKTEGYQHFGIA